MQVPCRCFVAYIACTLSVPPAFTVIHALYAYIRRCASGIHVQAGDKCSPSLHFSAARPHWRVPSCKASGGGARPKPAGSGRAGLGDAQPCIPPLGSALAWARAVRRARIVHGFAVATCTRRARLAVPRLPSGDARQRPSV